MVNALLSTPLWGALLHDAETAAAFGAEGFCRRLVAFERAWTEALLDCGLVTDAAATAAIAAIDAFDPATVDFAAATERDGVPVPALVRALREGLDADAAAAIHTGATSQDVVDTAMVLAVTDCLRLFEMRIGGLLDRIDALVRDHGGGRMMGRTRMQAALPIAVSDRLRTWSAPLGAQMESLPALLVSVGVIQAGGAVGTCDAHGEATEDVVEAVARRLGLGLSAVWHTDRSRILDAGNWLTKLAGALGKIGQDVALMAQQGVDEVRLSGGGGSSAMPHKQNPVRAEALVALARFVAGQQGTLAQAMVHEQERSGAAWAIEWLTLPSMFVATGAALIDAERLLDQITSLGTADG